MLGFYAGVTVEALLEDRVVGVDLVQDGVGVFLDAGGEGDEFVELGEALEDVVEVGPKPNVYCCVMEFKIEL